jgi:hypothetical protein
MNPMSSLTTTPLMDTTSILDPPTTNSTPAGDAACVCKWQHAPGLLCHAVFPTASALHKHVKTAHVDNCASCFCQWEGCDASSKDFKQRSKLSRHLLGHAGYRPYACSYAGCDKTFATNQAKDNHERTHTGERPYVCDRCGYTTTTHTQLQTHISALHEGKKPHKCRFCDFTCADSSNLSKHERTHQVCEVIQDAVSTPIFFLFVPPLPRNPLNSALTCCRHSVPTAVPTRIAHSSPIAAGRTSSAICDAQATVLNCWSS